MTFESVSITPGMAALYSSQVADKIADVTRPPGGSFTLSSTQPLLACYVFLS